MSSPAQTPTQVSQHAAMAAVDGDTPTGNRVTTAPLDERYQARVAGNQDLVILISDYHNRRGTGKTALSLQLAKKMDRTDDGVTKDKCTLDAAQLLDQYTEAPNGSALLLDEAETQASKFRAGTHVNKALRDLVAMGRVEEKYLIMNMPASSEIDKDLLGLADVWILVTRKGQALVHMLANEPYNAKILTPKSEVVEWPDIPTNTNLRRVYNALTRQKQRRLRGEEGETLIKEAEVNDRIRKAEKQTARETRDGIIHGLIHEAGLTPTEIEPAFDVKRARISQISHEVGD